jgi:hypothetical protein
MSKIRNYSFAKSKRIPYEKMTEVNSVKIPSLPGSCYHAILCGLAQYREHLVTWDKLTELVEKYMRQYGGAKSWNNFKNRKDVKTHQQRIKENVHTLTRTGRDCYGYRLHELGMAIYFFKDGAMLLTGGKFATKDSTYTVTFPDGRGLQARYRGTTMTSKEYKRFLEEGIIDKSACILNHEQLRASRLIAAAKANSKNKKVQRPLSLALTMYAKVVLHEDFDQQTATRLEQIGFIVDKVNSNELYGQIPSDRLGKLESDKDVLDVQIVKSDLIV